MQQSMPDGTGSVKTDDTPESMNIAVFCASAQPLEQVFIDAARTLGQQIAEERWQLVYGGTNIGLMREVAEATINRGGYVTGIIPECILQRGVAARQLSHLIVAPDMKERKHLLRENADAFIALPGGWGTLEEITEVITLKQLGQHTKPIIFINTAGFYDRFFDFISGLTQQGFISSVYKGLYEIVGSPEEAVHYLKTYRGSAVVSKY